MPKRAWPDAKTILEQVGQGRIDDRMVADPDESEAERLAPPAADAPDPRHGARTQRVARTGQPAQGKVRG